MNNEKLRYIKGLLSLKRMEAKSTVQPAIGINLFSKLLKGLLLEVIVQQSLVHIKQQVKTV